MELTKRAIFTYGHKGGVGKSTFGAALLDYFRRHGIPCAAFDSDYAVRHLYQYYGTKADNDAPEDPLVGVSLVDLKQPRARDGLVNILDRNYPRILLDMPAGSATDLEEGFGLGTARALYEEYASCGYRITLATVITPIFASTEAVQIAFETFGRNVDHLVVKNLHYGEENQFPFFDGFEENGAMRYDKTKKSILQSGGMVIGLPKLRADTFAMIDKYALNFTNALESTTLSRADRSRVHQWREECGNVLRQAGHLLGLDDASVVA
ncbi:MAG: hypothetical protein F8N36_13845 [Desulfovibrio sp.]|uniref:hypothetical protein n=1 Tax=Desulfovibrio sp. TaxID=885 RepID=UPI00135D7B53|nr:hypothetical protein [Desulfovibrio sp.]MTJ93921.1 hypothetical protein [Desulfovibrio sp.]